MRSPMTREKNPRNGPWAIRRLRGLGEEMESTTKKEGPMRKEKNQEGEVKVKKGESSD